MTDYRILLVSHEMSLSGAPQSLLRQARYLLDAGYAVSVWTMRPGPLEQRYAAEGLKVEVVPFDRSDVRRRVETTAPALVVCNTCRTFQFADLFASLRIPTIWFIRETGDLKAPFAHDRDFRRVLSTFYSIYTVSEYARDIVAGYNGNVQYFNNSVPDEYRGPTPPSPVLRFGFIGSTDRRKGLRELLLAFKSAFGNRSDVAMAIAGAVAGSEEGESLQRHFADMPSVVWKGEVSGEEKRRFFDATDVICMPSKDESSGLSLLEGAMYGKALLATDHVGAKYVVGAENGIVVPIERLVDGMEFFDKRRTELPAMQRASRQMYLTLATPELERKNVLRMVEAGMSNPPPESYPAARPIRQFFKKTDVDADHWRFFILGVPVLKCRKVRWIKRMARRVLGALGIDVVRLGFSAEEE